MFPLRTVRWLVLLVLIGCGMGQQSASDSAQSEAADVAVSADERALQRIEPSHPGEGGDSTQPGARRLLIRTGSARLEVDTIQTAVARVRRLATDLGGYVGNVRVQAGSETVRSTDLTLKIPAAQFDRALSGLDPIGRVRETVVTTEDVGEQYVDAEARLANARRLEARLLDLLANRTGKLEEVLAVERELARVREEIERFQGRLRYLSTDIAVSTLSVTLVEPTALLSGDGSPFAKAFRTAGQLFVGTLTTLIASLGVLVPLGLVAAALWWLVRWVRRRRRPTGGVQPLK